jgi:hypothetical protein
MELPLEIETDGAGLWTSAEWQGPFFERLAVVCQACGLTALEARSVNCSARGLSLVEAGRVLGLEGNPVQIRGAMWQNLHRASGKLAAFVYSRQRPRSGQRPSTSSNEFLWEVLRCMRTFESKPRPMMYDSLNREVTARARLVIPDDLKRSQQPQPDWLDDLCVTIHTRLEEGHHADERQSRQAGQTQKCRQTGWPGRSESAAGATTAGRFGSATK